MKIENVCIEKRKGFSVDVDGVNIKLVNKKYLRLYVNEELQDVFWGLFVNSAKLIGKMPDGRKIKVCFGGHFVVHYAVFVDDKLVLNTYKNL